MLSTCELVLTIKIVPKIQWIFHLSYAFKWTLSTKATYCTHMNKHNKAETGDSEAVSSITQAEVSELLKKILSSKALWVDKIHSEYFKSRDVVAALDARLTCLCNTA